MGIAKGKGERGEERGEGGKCSFFIFSVKSPCMLWKFVINWRKRRNEMIDYDLLLDSPEEYLDLIAELEGMETRLNEIVDLSMKSISVDGKERIYTLNDISMVKTTLTACLKNKLYADFLVTEEE